MRTHAFLRAPSLNVFASLSDYASGTTISGDNLTYQGPNDHGARGSANLGTGRWHFEALVNSVSGTLGQWVGICDADLDLSSANQFYSLLSWSYSLASGDLRDNASSHFAYGPSLAAGDVLMVEVDLAAGKVWFGRNGTWAASGNPSTGANPAYTGISATSGLRPFVTQQATSANSTTFNFGAGNISGAAYDPASGGSFKYAPTAGFKALSRYNGLGI